MVIENYQKCSCGAITFYTTEGTYSCKQKNIKKFFNGIDLRKITRLNISYCCDYCVNHYGLELCGCGSGELFGKCSNHLSECSKPMQLIRKYNRVIAKNSWI